MVTGETILTMFHCLFPQDEAVAKLTEANKLLTRQINEISKNIDRLENGQGSIFLLICHVVG